MGMIESNDFCSNPRLHVDCERTTRVTDRCPHVTYREEGDGRSFDEARAYCTVVDRFVQPMRADVCNRRYGLEPETDCEFYREHEGIDPFDETLEEP